MGAVATPIEGRILSALAAAGTDGLDREALLDATLGEEDVEPAEEAACNRLIGDLIERGLVHLRTHGVHILTLSAAEWARRLKAMVDIEGTELTAEAIERLLAGTDPQ